LRTAVVLCGTGTAGLYQAGALKALAEAGVKIDLVAGHGPGVANALCAGINGESALWQDQGPWALSAASRAYRWRPALKLAALGLLLAIALLLSPLLILVVAAAAYGLSGLAALLNLTGASEWLVLQYQRLFEFLFFPPVLPTMMPRAVVLAMLVVVGVLIVAALRASVREPSRRRIGGAFWWRLLGAPIAAEEPGRTLLGALWKLVKGASGAPSPERGDLGRRYVDVLTDNLGQPGFREVLVAVHDVDSRRDLVGAVLQQDRRGRFDERRPGQGPREAEVIEFDGVHKDLVSDFLLASLRLPVATPLWPLRFPPDGYWRGELHHASDRPELPVRLLAEVAAVGVDQVILVSPAPPASPPHALRPRAGRLRARIGEQIRAVETAALDDAYVAATQQFASVFVIRPHHNPIGPFDFGGVYDDASDRRRPARELLQQGYEDAYTGFIDPYVAAGERLHEL
jgi:hypothetical protein